MKHLFNAASALALYLSTSGFAHAVFSTTAVPEPETAALIVAGALVAVALRRLAKRNRDRRHDE